MAFLAEYMRPFRKVFAVTAVLSVVAAFADVALLWYLGRLIDLMAATGPAAFIADHGVEVGLVALAVLVLRPMILVGNVALLHNTILPNFGTMIRWRSHRHVIRQPVGWFEVISPGGSPTGSCRRHPRRAMRCSRPLMPWPLPASR